jgi:hypothetical protein
MAIVLDNQNCDIRLYWRGRLYMDLDKDGINIFCGLKALNLVPMPLYRYQQFSGKLFWLDMQGADNPRDPHYRELGVRYKLFYITEAEIDEMLDAINANKEAGVGGNAVREHFQGRQHEDSQRFGNGRNYQQTWGSGGK